MKKRMKRAKSSLIKAIRKSKKSGYKARRLNELKAKAGDEPRLDKFIDENTPVNVDDAMVTHPTQDDVRDVLSELDGYRDYMEESRGNGLTYGDY